MTSPYLDIFTEPVPDRDTLANLGPLRPLAGVWEGIGGLDEHPIAEGAARDPYVERYELQPIDPQTNGPQLLYGLRYHVFITKPGDTATFHDQIGYWLWEPATGTVSHTIAIPRAQVVLATGHAAADSSQFEVSAERGLTTNGICSGPFLDEAYKTTSFSIRVTVNSDGTWSYEEDTVIEVLGREEPFHHTDHNTLRQIAAPTPNPMAH